MINSYGTVNMIDPLLEGFDMPLLIDMPINPQDVEYLDAIFVSHIDNDHYSRPTCRDLKAVCKEYHVSFYVASLMKEECGIDGNGHDIGERILVNDVDVELTAADHAWQNIDEQIISRVVELADRRNCEMTQISLAWLLTKVTSVIVGATKAHHLTKAVKALEIELTDEEINYLEELYQPHVLVGVMAQNK